MGTRIPTIAKIILTHLKPKGKNREKIQDFILTGKVDLVLKGETLVC